MAKECLDYCPRIRTILKGIDSDNVWSGPLAFHPDTLGDDTGANRLLQACKRTYDCPGPTSQTIQRQTGILRRKVSTRVVYRCSLDQPKLDNSP